MLMLILIMLVILLLLGLLRLKTIKPGDPQKEARAILMQQPHDWR
jgi:hypothetical protein